MKLIIQLFLELFSKFPSHFIFLVLGVFFQAVTSALAVVVIAPITDLLLQRTGSEASSITAYFESTAAFFGYDFNLFFASVFFGVFSLINGVFAVLVTYFLFKIRRL